jgi:haloalkane dehalogenase
MRTVLLIGSLAIATGVQEIRPGVFRTPDDRFQDLPEYSFSPHYVEVMGFRVHYVDEGSRDAPVVLLLHGEPTWSYLYRKMIPILSAAGLRAIAPDLIGFGRSDKPADMDVHTYAFHVAAMKRFIAALNLREVTFFGQDWGGLIGLRVVAESPDRFAAVVIANTGLPTGDGEPSPAFHQWKQQNATMIAKGDMPVGSLVATFTGQPALAAPYDAPFPDPRYKAGPLIMPQRVPVSPDDPARSANLAAWAVLSKWEKPFVTAFGDSDPITQGLEQAFQDRVPGAKGQRHHRLEGAGHFLQETHAGQLATIIIDVLKQLPGTRKESEVGLNLHP